MQTTFGVHVMNLWRGQNVIFPVPTRWRSNWGWLFAYETVQIKDNEKQSGYFNTFSHSVFMLWAADFSAGIMKSEHWSVIAL